MKAEAKFGSASQVPYEAFVVSCKKKGVYEIIYPYDDQWWDHDFEDDDETWGFVNSTSNRVDDLLLLNWTLSLEDETSSL